METKYFASLNLSKLGFRYFRIVLETKLFSKKFVRFVVNHPNTGYVFQGRGWSGKKQVLGIGVWATTNAEMIDISNLIRSKMPRAYKVVYQSELTHLEFFSGAGKGRARMVLIDELENKVPFSPRELAYLKLISVDGSLTREVLANILGVTPREVQKLDDEVRTKGVHYGLFENKQLPKGYTKFFVDTSALLVLELEKYVSILADDERCIYLAQGNGKYNFEFEYVMDKKSDFNRVYGELTRESKQIIFDDNLFTNLFPQSKFNNIKKVQDTFSTLARKNQKYFDLRNSELWYVNQEGAEAYLKIYADEKYKKHMNLGEVRLFPGAVRSLKNSSDRTYNIIDIGSGDGTKGKRLIEEIGKEKIRSYFPVDIQEVELAQALKEHEGATYSVHPTVLNFNNLSARFPVGNKPKDTSVYALFGGTYGNFPASEINEYLKPILSGPTDALLVAMPIREHMTEEEILASYLNSGTEAVGFSVLKQIGFTGSDFVPNPQSRNLKVHLRIEENRVISYFVLKSHVHILGFHLEPGTRFDVLTSWKPTKKEFIDALEKDFLIEKCIANKSFAMAVCRKK